MLVLPEKLLIGMLWVEVPLDNFDPFQTSSLFFVDAWSPRFVSVSRLGCDSAKLTGWSVWLTILSEMAKHQVLF